LLIDHGDDQPQRPCWAVLPRSVARFYYSKRLIAEVMLAAGRIHRGRYGFYCQQG